MTPGAKGKGEGGGKINLYQELLHGQTKEPKKDSQIKNEKISADYAQMDFFFF